MISRWVYFFKGPHSMPFKKRVTDVTYDIYAHEQFSIAPGELKTIITNVGMEIKRAQCGLLSIRLAYANKGLLVNSGVIDSHYMGPLTVILFNAGSLPVHININQRYLQLLIVRVAGNYPLVEIDQRVYGKKCIESQRGRVPPLNE